MPDSFGFLQIVPILILATVGTLHPGAQTAVPVLRQDSPPPQIHSRILTPMPKPGWAFAAAMQSGNLHVLGGENSTCGHRRDHFVYDPQANNWRYAAPMLIQRNIFEAVSLRGRIYAIAGNISCGAIETDAVEAYEPEFDLWQTCASLPRKLWFHAAAVLDGRIYVFGGVDQSDVLNRNVFVYEPVGNSWSQGMADFPVIAGHPYANPACSAATFGDSIYMIVPDASFERYWLYAYAPSTSTWFGHGDIPLPYAYVWETPHIVALENCLLVIHNTEVNGRVQIQLYDPSSLQWSPVDTAHVSFNGFSNVQVVGDGVGFYVLGGFRGWVHSDQVQYLCFLNNQPPVIDVIAAQPALLWPPNHKMDEICLTIQATDDTDAPENLRIVSATVSSSEPDDALGLGDGRTVGDTDGFDGYSQPVDISAKLIFNPVVRAFQGAILLRAERDGNGGGRTYTISVTVADTSGNMSSGTSSVVVPHDAR